MTQLEMDFDEPIKIIHIGPTSVVADLSLINDGMDMVLTHLVLNNQEYRETF